MSNSRPSSPVTLAQADRRFWPVNAAWKLAFFSLRLNTGYQPGLNRAYRFVLMTSCFYCWPGHLYCTSASWRVLFCFVSSVCLLWKSSTLLPSVEVQSVCSPCSPVCSLFGRNKVTETAFKFILTLCIKMGKLCIKMVLTHQWLMWNLCANPSSQSSYLSYNCNLTA